MLGRLLGADPGYRGPRVPCGQGHEAGFVSYRDKVIDTVLGPVTLTRAWYHCAACKHGLAPRDAELGVPHASMSPGLRAMNDQAAAAGPFAKAARLLENLAGVRLTVKRVERAAEASGGEDLGVADLGGGGFPGRVGDQPSRVVRGGGVGVQGVQGEVGAGVAEVVLPPATVSSSASTPPRRPGRCRRSARGSAGCRRAGRGPGG